MTDATLISVANPVYSAPDNSTVDMELTWDPGDSHPVESAGPRTDMFTWHPDDPHGLGPQVTEYFAAHQEVQIAPYVPPVIASAEVDAEMQRRYSIATGSALAMFQVNGVPIPDSVKAEGQVILDRGAALKAMNPIPADYATEQRWQ